MPMLALDVDRSTGQLPMLQSRCDVLRPSLRVSSTSYLVQMELTAPSSNRSIFPPKSTPTRTHVKDFAQSRANLWPATATTTSTTFAQVSKPTTGHHIPQVASQPQPVGSSNTPIANTPLLPSSPDEPTDRKVFPCGWLFDLAVSCSVPVASCA
jgi:hypothetical protein